MLLEIYQRDKVFGLENDIDFFTVRLILKVLLNRSNENNSKIFLENHFFNRFIACIYCIFWKVMSVMSISLLPLSQENLQ